MNKNKIIKEFVDFVEGRMTFAEFQRNYEINNDYKKLLDDKKPNKNYPYYADRTIDYCLHYFKWTTSEGRHNVQKFIIIYLEYYHISFEPTNLYEKEVKYKLSIQPSYIEIEDDEFLDNIIKEAPKELCMSKKKLWIKNKIKEKFKYDSRPPRWIQDPEWPIVNGKPLVFKKQSRQIINDERVFYTFYDPDTLEETVIMQLF